MSRVHDALRRAEEAGMAPEEAVAPLAPREPPLVEYPGANGGQNGAAAHPPLKLNLHPGMLGEVQVAPFRPAPESHLLDLNNSHETPAEEFRTLRTRLNHLQT